MKFDGHEVPEFIAMATMCMFVDLVESSLGISKDFQCGIFLKLK